MSHFTTTSPTWEFPMRRVATLVSFGAITAFYCLNPLAALAQVQFESKQLGGKSDEDQFRSQQAEFNRLQDGSLKYDAAMHKDLVVIATRYYALRVTWLNIQSDYKPAPTKTLMDNVRYDFQVILIDRIAPDPKSADPGKNELARIAIGNELTQRFKEIFAWPFEQNRLSHVNGAMLLPEMARLKTNDVGKYLSDLVKEPKTNDVVRFFAIKALGEFFPAREFVNLDEGKKPLEEQKLRDIDRVDLLIKLIERDWNVKNADAAEMEAIRYVRREAIKSLARSSVPAIEVARGKVNGAAVYTLMRVLADDGLNPTATMPEKIEAAIGVCQLKPREISAYDPELGLYLIAKFLHEFGSAYQKDWTESRVAKRFSIPWKFHAARIKAALATQVTHLNNINSNRKTTAQKLQTESTAMFNDIGFYNSVAGQLDRVGKLASDLRPATTTVFKNIPPLALKMN